ncbi:hypothetical protein CDAR_515881 [Caerostris darwini]|uniref:Uncharacterized protein n=1 Tax=Caerostris darwini TaxID=1538125 RepID=A0AAV4TZE3_9ARAC|nr:hypothetical protein CDAR_515881 [Caerostris darwini]
MENPTPSPPRSFLSCPWYLIGLYVRILALINKLASTNLVHGRAPEIVEEQVGPGARRSQVSVFSDGGHVIEDEPAVEGAPVTQTRPGAQQGVAQGATLQETTCRPSIVFISESFD